MRAWISNCLHNDLECNPPGSWRKRFFPRQLLRITPSQHSLRITLVECKEWVDYVALSYCWGSGLDGVLRTTKSNVQQLRKGFDRSVLPRTIQDAITVTQKVGFLYLWVGSICIIQYDKQDWLEQSAQMQRIYQNCVFTIAAEETSSCKMGFLGPQKCSRVDFQVRCQIDVPGQNSEENGDVIFIRRPTQEAKEPAVCALDQRGWCLQESIMPNRRLIFTGGEMVWECVLRTICECGHREGQTPPWARLKYGLRDASHIPRLYGLSKAQDAQLNEESKTRLGRLDLDDMYPNHRSSVDNRQWLQLVKNYSRRSLTQDADKLVVISGLATSLVSANTTASGPADKYVAGLWKLNLVLDLAWNADREALGKASQRLHRRFGSYVAPSWSWASIDGPIRFQSLSDGSWCGNAVDPPRIYREAIVEDVSTTPISPSAPTGRISAAQVIIKGVLIPV